MISPLLTFPVNASAETSLCVKTHFKVDFMKIYIIAFLTLMPLLLLGTAVSVISQSADELLLEFKLPEYQIEQASKNGST